MGLKLGTARPKIGGGVRPLRPPPGSAPGKVTRGSLKGRRLLAHSVTVRSGWRLQAENISRETIRNHRACILTYQGVSTSLDISWQLIKSSYLSGINKHSKNQLHQQKTQSRNRVGLKRAKGRQAALRGKTM